MIKRLTLEFKKWLLLSAFADGLQDRARLTFAACLGLPHNICDAKLREGRKIGKAKMKDWLIEGNTNSKHPTQEVPTLFVGDRYLLRKHVNQGSAHVRTMIIQSPVCGAQESEQGNSLAM